MQWSKFFNVAGKPPTARPVRQFDANLSDALFRLPATALPDNNPMSRGPPDGTSSGAGRCAFRQDSRSLG